MKKILILLLTIIGLNSFGQIPSIGGILPINTVPSIVLNSVTNNFGWCNYLVDVSIFSDGGFPITEKGIVFNLVGNPTITDTKWNTLNLISGTTYQTNCFAFKENTHYYVRAYAINSSGITYSNQLEINTNNAASVYWTVDYISGTEVDINLFLIQNGNEVTTKILYYNLGSGATSGTSIQVNGNTNYTWHLTGLTPNTKYAYNFFISSYNCIIINPSTSEDSYFTTSAGQLEPVVTTSQPSSITATTVTSGGEVIDQGSSSVTARGVCYSTSSDPNIAGNKTSDGTGVGSFTSSITGLTANTTYYTRAYATNSVSTAYGANVSFTTSGLYTPIVSTDAISNITETTATSGGNVTSQGTSTVSSRGICWSTSQNPTTANSSAASGSGTGTFTANLTGLTANTTYYVRAYATNIQGTGYGNNVIFTTPAPPSVSLTINSAFETSISVNYNGASCPTNITEIGAVLSSSTRTPTIANTKISEYPSGVCTYNNNNNFIGLNNSTEYFIRAFITNSFGTFYSAVDSITTGVSQTCPTVTTTTVSNILAVFGAASGGNVTSSGGASVTARGVCWNTAGSPTISDTKTVNGNGLGSFSSSITGLTANTTYYVRAYATNGIGTCYGSEITFHTWPTYSQYNRVPLVSCSGYGSGILDTSQLNIKGSTYKDFANNYVGAAWKYIEILSFNPDVDADGKDFIALKDGASEITTFPHLVDVQGVAENSSTSISIVYNDPTNELCKNSVSQMATIAYRIIDVNNAIGALQAVAYDMNGQGYSTHSPATNITATSAIVDGSSWGSEITASGLYWNTNGDQYNKQFQVNRGALSGGFSIALTNLTPNTTYYYNSFCTSTYSTTGGTMSSFTTLSGSSVLAPSIRTTTVSNIESTSTTSGGNVIGDNGASVTARGVCYGISVNPTISGTKTSDGTGVGVFTSSITGLSANTTYYYRAYATNSVGTNYGEEFTFTTPATNTIPTVTILTPANNITSTTASLTGRVTNTGGLPILTRGVCWSTSENPTLANSNALGEELNTFDVDITGLTRITGYWYRTYATNSLGTGYSEQQFFLTNYGIPILTTTTVTNITNNSATSGGTIVDNGGFEGNSGICWSLTLNPTINNFSTSDTGNPFNSNMTGLYANSTYYVRAYFNTFQGIFYGDEISFTTSSICTRPIGLNTYIFWNSIGIDGSWSSFWSSLAAAKQACFDWNSEMGRDVQLNGTSVQAASIAVGQTVYDLVGTNCNLVGDGYFLLSENKINKVIRTIDGVISAIYNGIEVGDSFGGGLVAYLYNSSDPGYSNMDVNGMISATTDQSSGIEWGCQGTLLGVTTNSIGVGLSNTLTILSGCDTRPIAASVARDHNGGGFTDWFLPTTNELSRVCGSASILGFSSGSYWGSNETNATEAKTQDIVGCGGTSHNVTKNTTNKVRAFRYF